MLTISEQLIRDEGLRLKMYQDSRGIWTIGIGHNLEAKAISEPAARQILADDIQDAWQELYQALPWVTSLNEARQGVLLNMAFNLGVAGLLAFRLMLQAAKIGAWNTAADEMMRSKWAEQVGARASRLELQMRTGQWK